MTDRLNPLDGSAGLVSVAQRLIVTGTKAANANSVLTLTLTPAAGKTAYVYWWTINPGIGATNIEALVTLSLDGGGTTAMNFRYVWPSVGIPYPMAIGKLPVLDSIAATGPDTSIILTVPALGATHPAYSANMVGYYA